MAGNDFQIELSRDKWREIPSTRQGRIFSSDAMKMDDAQLLAWWEECRAENCRQEVKGWYQNIYKDVFRGKTIVDIGPGAGMDGIFFIENGAKVTFADIHRDNLALLERICRLKGLDAEFYYIDDVEKYDFPYAFDAFVAIGSLLHAPFDFTRKQLGALVPFLKPGGMVLWLGYPYERFALSGAADGVEFAKITDGERTPWAEWYDKAKIERLFGSNFTVSLDVNFGTDLMEFNLFQVDKADNPSLPETDRTAFPRHLPVPSRYIRKTAQLDDDETGDVFANEIFVWNAGGHVKSAIGSYEPARYAKDRDRGKPAIGDDLVFTYSTIRDHVAIPYFSMPADIREGRSFLLELNFPIVLAVSCQWRIMIQDGEYATLADLHPPHKIDKFSDCLRMRIPFAIQRPGISKMRIVFCPEFRAGEGVLPLRIRIRETKQGGSHVEPVR